MTIGVDIAAAVEILRRGGLIGLPTETVYGLGADASNPGAVAKIFAAKRRPSSHPLIVHLADSSQLGLWANQLSPVALQLAASFWPGPLTLIVQRSERVSSTVTGGATTVGLRVPAHPMAQQLLRAFGGGIAAPSANRFGAVSPTTAQHVASELGSDVDYIVDGGSCSVGIESTIVDVSDANKPATLLRPGGVTRSELEAVIGPIDNPTALSPVVSGSLVSHYAPRATVVVASQHEIAAVLAALISSHPTQRIAVMAPSTWLTTLPIHNRVHVAALANDNVGYARDLYATMRDLDDTGVELIVAALPPADGVGEAVVDRLLRAAGPRSMES
jgi:L-threonylcarbamoyladenylate synthase